MAAPRPEPLATVDQVIDPDGAVQLVRVYGVTSRHTVDTVDAITATLGPHHTLHLDLIDAEITSEHTMRDFERLADRLEQAMVHVRVVGVDPDHPALRQRS